MFLLCRTNNLCRILEGFITMDLNRCETGSRYLTPFRSMPAGRRTARALPCPYRESRGRAGGYASAAARFAAASSAEVTPPCAADHATGSSRNLRTSDNAASEKYGRSPQASSTSHQVHR